MKPFNLEDALSGKAVKLRYGTKAFVRYHETELPVDESVCLTGFTAYGRSLTWCENGDYYIADEPHDYDIIGMYPETHTINGFEVPAPETQAPEEGATYYFPILHTFNLYGTDEWYRDEEWHERCLKRGLVFLNKEDAIANAKAMMGIDPNSEDES